MTDKEARILKKIESDSRKLNEKKATRIAEWYTIDRLLGNDWAIFYVLLGARGVGKSYTVLEWFIKQFREHGTKFTWLCLSQMSQKTLLADNANMFIDPDLCNKYKINKSTRGMKVYDNGVEMCQILDLSSMPKNKVLALFDADYKGDYHIALDEMNREKQERRMFDIIYNFKNTLEGLLRHTTNKVRCFMIGNLLQEGSDILSMFNFMPYKEGVYKLKRRKAVVEFIKPTETMIERRKNSVVGQLGADDSSFSNIVQRDMRCITKKRLHTPSIVLDFGGVHGKFTLWNDNIITQYKDERKPIIALLRHTDERFDEGVRDQIFKLYDVKFLLYLDWMTLYKFRMAMKEIRLK